MRLREQIRKALARTSLKTKWQLRRMGLDIRKDWDATNPARREQRNALHKRFLEAARVVQPIHAGILPPGKHLHNRSVQTAQRIIRHHLQELELLRRVFPRFHEELFPVLSASEIARIQSALHELLLRDIELEKKRKALWKQQRWFEKEFGKQKKKPAGAANLERKIRESLDFVMREEQYSMDWRQLFKDVLPEQEHTPRRGRGSI